MEVNENQEIIPTCSLLICLSSRREPRCLQSIDLTGLKRSTLRRETLNDSDKHSLLRYNFSSRSQLQDVRLIFLSHVFTDRCVTRVKTITVILSNTSWSTMESTSTLAFKGDKLPLYTIGRNDLLILASLTIGERFWFFFYYHAL